MRMGDGGQGTVDGVQSIDTMPKVYRVPLSLKIWLAISGCFAVLLAILVLIGVWNSLVNLSWITLLTFSGIILLGVAASYLFFWPLFRIEITEHGIGSYRFGHENSLRWDEIGEIKSKGIEGDLTLISHTGDKKIKVSAQVAGFEEILDRLREKRPDLCRQRVFHGGVGLQILLVLMGLLLIAVGLNGLREGHWPSLILVVFGCAPIVFIFDLVRLLDFQGNELKIKKAFRERKIPGLEIKEIWLREISTNESISYAVLVELKKGKPIPLGNFREGAPILYNSLKLWLKEQRNRESNLELH